MVTIRWKINIWVILRIFFFFVFCLLFIKRVKRRSLWRVYVYVWVWVGGDTDADESGVIVQHTRPAVVMTPHPAARNSWLHGVVYVPWSPDPLSQRARTSHNGVMRANILACFSGNTGGWERGVKERLLHRLSPWPVSTIVLHQNGRWTVVYVDLVYLCCFFFLSKIIFYFFF